MKINRKYLKKKLSEESLKEGMSRLEIMKYNKALYSRLEKSLNNLPDGLKKYVIKYYGLPWCKNNNWLGGMSDSASNKAIYKILSLGDYTKDEIMDEMDNFISCFEPDTNKSEDEKLKLYLNESLSEDLFNKPSDIADSISKYLDSKNFYNYELIDYDSYPMNTSMITFEVDGDWKHDHLRFKDLVYDWSFENNKNIFKIDSELVRDDGSDSYASNYFVYVTKDEDALSSLKSMSKLFSEEYEDDVDNWQYLDVDQDYKSQKDYFIPELRDEVEIVPGELSRRFKKYLNKEEESLNEDFIFSNNDFNFNKSYKYTGKVFFDNLKDPDHYAVDRNDLYSNLFDFDIKNDTSLDSKIRKAIEKVDYDIFIDDENDHKYEDDDNNDSNYDDYDDDDGSSGSISITIITNRSLTKKEIDKLEKFYVETGNESYFTGILDDLVFTEYSNKEAIKKLEHDCYMIVANGVKKFEETFIKPFNLYGYSNASIHGGGVEKGEITGQYDFNYRYKNYTIYSDTHLIRIPIDEIYSNPEKYINQIFNDLKDEWLREVKDVDSKSVDESLKEDLNIDDFIEPVDQVGKAKIYYDSNKRTYFTPSLDLDFDTLDQAKDFIGAPLYTGESLNETIVYPNGMPASDIDIHDALNFNFGLDRDMNDDNYTDEEKQRSLNYWINKMDEIDESLNEASYGGAYDIEDDMFFTKEELVEFAGDIAEEFSKLTGHPNCDVDNVYMENDPLALNVDIYDPKDEVSHSAYTRIDMRKIRKPSDIYKYMDRILKQLEDSYLEYHANDEEYYE